MTLGPDPRVIPIWLEKIELIYFIASMGSRLNIKTNQNDWNTKTNPYGSRDLYTVSAPRL